MPNDDFNPDLTKLDGNYQVLTELRGEGDSRTYLARHLQLNRDVTISVFRAGESGSADALTQFASDTRLLIDARHPHVVPIIDGLWLDDRTFATVRARVRGATLDQVLGASGPMSIGLIGATIRDVSDAILWARDIGVAQRDVAPWDIVFQQGNGRVLLAFEPAKAASAAEHGESNDAQTVRRLAIEMLSGQIDRGVSAQEIPVPRNIPSAVADALAAMRYSTRRNTKSAIDALLAALDGTANQKLVDEKVLMPVRNAAPAVPDQPTLPGHRVDAVILSKPSYGFNARLGTAIVIIAAAAVGGFMFLSRGDTRPTNVAVVAPAETGTSASGEVSLHSPPRPTSPPIASHPAQKPDSARVPRRTLTPPPRVTSTASDSLATERTMPSRPESTTVQKRPVIVDSAADAERRFKRDSAADVENPCLSAEASSQRTCLTESIQRNDRELNAVYGRLVAALRRQAGVGAGEPDPDGVNALRAEEREWTDGRETTCAEVGDEPLYAKSRAACYAQKAADRARELQRRLDSIAPTTFSNTSFDVSCVLRTIVCLNVGS